MTSKIEAHPIGGETLEKLLNDKLHYVTCESCGHTLLVWPNRNVCTCHRARCLACKKGPSYYIETKKHTVADITTTRATMVVIQDTYQDHERMLSLHDCEISIGLHPIDEPPDGDLEHTPQTLLDN